MALKGDIGLYLSGLPVPVKDCNIILTPPKIKEIVASTGEDNFLTAVQIMGHTDVFVGGLREGNPELDFLSDFQILLVILRSDLKTKFLIKGLFDLIFPEYDVQILENSLEFYLKETGNLIFVMNPFNFESFQEILIELFEPAFSKNEEFNPIDDKAKEIAEKIKRGRDRVNKMKKSGERAGSKSLFATQTSILSVGLGIDINIFYNYTPFQLHDAFIRFTSKMASDFYQRVSSMPLLDTSKMEAPEEWTRGLY